MPGWKNLFISLVATSTASAAPCSSHLSGLTVNQAGEILVVIPKTYQLAHVTGDRVFSLAELLRILDFANADIKGRRVLSIAEEYSALVPHLNASGAHAIALDLWYHLGSLPDTRAGREMADYVRTNRRALLSADGRALPFADRTFDVVTNSFLLHYLSRDYAQTGDGESMARLLVEIGRVLKNGGTARLVTYNWNEGDRAELESFLAANFARETFSWRVRDDKIHINDIETGKPLVIPVFTVRIDRRE